MRITLLVAVAAAIWLSLAGTALAQDERRLVDVDGYGSCSIYEIHDAEGKALQLPEHIQTALDCPSLRALSPGGTLLLLDDGFHVLLHGLDTGDTHHIMDLEENVHGVSGALWSNSGDRVLFSSVVQEQGHVTKLHMLFLDDPAGFWVASKDVRMNMVCGSICAANPGEDYWLEPDGRVGYLTWDEIPYDLEGEAAVRYVVLP
ncbi:MAG: hypothetical protein D6E12_15215 [Desulfovibrio sp.]|nr:MAG: hypothetical protein D6E12_15215 [Desulfovibrio sp.]